MRLSPRTMLIGSIVTSLLVSVLLLGQASGATREEKRDKIRADLKNAATAEESHFVDAQIYTRVLDDLKAQGFDPSPNVRLIIARAGERFYCLEAQHDALGEVWHYSAKEGTPERGRC